MTADVAASVSGSLMYVNASDTYDDHSGQDAQRPLGSHCKSQLGTQVWQPEAANLCSGGLVTAVSLCMGAMDMVVAAGLG